MDQKDLGTFLGDECEHMELVARSQPCSWYPGSISTKVE